jgi:hypothetical protein
MDGILCFKDKTAKNIPFENRKKFDVFGIQKIMFQGQNRRKYSV